MMYTYEITYQYRTEKDSDAVRATQQIDFDFPFLDNKMLYRPLIAANHGIDEQLVNILEVKQLEK